MTYHSAFDVSLRSVSICIVDDEGTIQLESKVESDVDALVTCLKGFDRAIKSAAFKQSAYTATRL